MEVSICAFLTTTLDGGERSTSCPSNFPLEQRAPCGTHWMEGVMGTRMVWLWWQTDILNSCEGHNPGYLIFIIFLSTYHLHKKVHIPLSTGNISIVQFLLL